MGYPSCAHRLTFSFIRMTWPIPVGKKSRTILPTVDHVILLNEKGEPLRTWKISHAIPKKWLISDLNANENALVIETMELSYRYFTIQ